MAKVTKNVAFFSVDHGLLKTAVVEVLSSPELPYFLCPFQHNLFPAWSEELCDDIDLTEYEHSGEVDLICTVDA